MAHSQRPFEKLGKNLVKIRQERGWTQEATAEKIGISLTYYQALEAGIKAPAFMTLRNIRRELRADWNELLRGE